VFDPDNRDAVIAVLTEYRDTRHRYQRLADLLQTRFGEIARQLNLYPMISGRAKSLESFAEKIQRPGKAYADPIREATDMTGVRVITHTLDEVERFSAATRHTFIIDAQNSEDKEERLKFREFGYLSQHLIIQLKERPRLDGVPDQEIDWLMTCRAELQLRTLAQHVWAAQYHEMGYKNEFKLPGRWEREFGRMAALLESCDRGFQRLKDAISTYESTYGAYLDDDELSRLSQWLCILLEVMDAGDPNRVRVVHRLIRVYLSMGASQKLVSLLAREAECLNSYAPALRDAGIAYCKAYPSGSAEYAAGQEMLHRAIAFNPRDTDARCSLAGTLKRQGDRAGALRLYREAHLIDPTNPYPLGNYVAEELIQKRTADLLPYFRVTLEAASERCRQQVDVGVNLPWAFFDLGLFQLYLGDPLAGLRCYARGIQNANEEWMIKTANSTILDFLSVHLPLEGLTWVNKLLTLGQWAKKADGRTPPAAGAWKPELFDRPLLVIAGACGGLEAVYASQLQTLRESLTSFRGTIVGGGTRSGVAGLPGDLQELMPGEVTAIGYLPRGVEPIDNRRIRHAGGEEPIDGRSAHVRQTGGEDFSILEPLMFWEDLRAAGGDPATVRLIGFNGGGIAGAEYRIALALGARVGIVAGSGRQADALLSDPWWKGFTRLSRLNDRQDIARFFEG
jgi:ppGpp synthetase/RelA/SpoT-type nucleotidyltranferase